MSKLSDGKIKSLNVPKTVSGRVELNPWSSDSNSCAFQNYYATILIKMGEF